MPSRRVPRQINFHREIPGDQSAAPREFNLRDLTLDEFHGEFQGVHATLRRTDRSSQRQTTRLAPPCTDTSHTLACGHIVASRDPRCSVLCHDPRWGTKRSPHVCHFCQNASEESRFLDAYSIIQIRREELAQDRRSYFWSVPLAVWEAREDDIDERESKLKNSLSHTCRRLLLRVGVEGIRERVERFRLEAVEREERRQEMEYLDHEMFVQQWYEEEERNSAAELSRMREDAANSWRDYLRRCAWHATQGPAEEAEVRAEMEDLRRQIEEHENQHPPVPDDANTAQLLEQARQQLARELQRVEAAVRSVVTPQSPNHATGGSLESLQQAVLQRLADFDQQLLHGDPNISDSVMLQRVQRGITVLQEIILVVPSAVDNIIAAEAGQDRVRAICDPDDVIRDRRRPCELEIIARHELRARCQVREMTQECLQDLAEELHEFDMDELEEYGVPYGPAWENEHAGQEEEDGWEDDDQ